MSKPLKCPFCHSIDISFFDTTPTSRDADCKNCGASVSGALFRELAEDIMTLREELLAERKVVDMYADVNTWNGGRLMTDDSVSYVVFADCDFKCKTGLKIGGKAARKRKEERKEI